MRPLTKYLLIMIFPACMAQPLGAIEVYQWTDENGVVHFSQWAPGEQQKDVETLEVAGGEGAENGLGISEEDDPDGYRAHRQQMDVLWAEREARREADRERKVQASRTELIYLRPEDSHDYRYPYILPGHGNRPPHRPPNRPSRPYKRPGPLPGIDPEPPAATATWKRP